MNKEEIDKRIAEYDAMEQQLNVTVSESQKTMAQAQANLTAVSGAKQDCQYWLAKIEEKESSATPEVDEFKPMSETAPVSDGTFEIMDPNPENL